MITSMLDSFDRRTLVRGLGAFGLAAASIALPTYDALAEAYPERDVTFVVQSSPGGGSDIFARTLATVLDELKLLPDPLIIENRPGGSGTVAYSYIAAHRGEPYFLGTGGGNFYTTPLLGESPVGPADFTPIAAIAMDPYIMAVRAESEIKTLDDVKSKGTLVVGSTGIVTDPRFLAIKLGKVLGIEPRVVPFDGDGEVLSALLGSHIDVQFGNPSEILPQITSGALRAIAVTAPERLTSLPDVPTFRELGLDIELATIRGLFMPADIPPEAVAYWNDALGKLAASEEWRKAYVDRYNLVPYFLGSEDYAKHMAETNEMYASMMRELGLIQ